MSGEKPRITKVREEAPEAKKNPSRFDKWRLERAQKKRKKLAIQKAKAAQAAKQRSSYLDSIGSKPVSTETKQKVKRRAASPTTTTAKRSNKSTKARQNWLRGKLLKLRKQIRRTTLRFKQLSGSTKFATVAGVVSIALITGGIGLLKPFERGFTLSDNTDSELLGTQIEQDADFEVLDTSELRIDASRFDTNRQIYQFETTVSGVRVVVTQQPIPADVSEGQIDVQKLALSVPDSESINRFEVDGIGLLYVVDQSGSKQSVLFEHKDNLLVIITGDSTLSNEAWVEFIYSII
jgi:hypothetical protein